MHPRPSGVVALLTDFGARDPYVGVLRGAVLRHNSKALLVDLGHEVPAHDVAAGALWLQAAVGHFPAGTVHVAVVDPGVGSARGALAACAHGCYWLAPDNGLLTHVLAGDAAAELRAIDVAALQLGPISRTFHGRDVFAPIAGWLSGGRYGFTALGARATGCVRLPALAAGGPRVVHVDHFGNLITNVAAATLTGVAGVEVGGTAIALGGTYCDVAPGELLALIGSAGLLEIACNQGSAAARLRAGRDAPVLLRRSEERT
jgi:S-adenosylmethionine hydrolase